MDMNHMEYLETVAWHDIDRLRKKEDTYRGSWKKRGGAGAFFVAIRKADRLDEMVKRYGYDIFKAMQDGNGEDGTVLAEVQDLRSYLMLIEAEVLAQRAANELRVQPGKKELPRPEEFKPGTPEDGGHHSRFSDVVHGEPKPKIMERLQDGLKPWDLEEYQKQNYFEVQVMGQSYCLVARATVPVEMWEHLPRLRIELNDKEYQETSHEYQALYRWENNDNKWKMRDQFCQHWGS